MRCRQARAAIRAAAEGELALEGRFALDEHVARCAACAALEARQRRLQELLEGPGDPAPVRADVEAAVRTVFARLERGEGERVRLPEARSARVKPWLVLAASAAVLALVFLWGQELRRDAPSQVEGPSVPSAELAWAESEVEVAVRGALLASFAGAEPSGEALELFQERLREPARAGWPLRRFVQELVASPDEGLATCAVRCLGALGDANALATLERALTRPELAATAFEALLQLGEPACGALERVLAEPELAPQALGALCRIGGARAADILERAARVARADAVPSRAALLDALTTTGPAAVASLLRLAGEARERSESQALLARLPLVAGAGPALVAELERVRAPSELHYRALLLLQPFEALPWLEERCASHRERAAALEVLVGYPGTPPFASLLALAAQGRAPHDELVGVLVGLLERDAVRAPEFSRTLVARGGALELRTWQTLLLESEHAGAAAALVPLVLAGVLAEEERQWAALALGELGGADEARELLDALLRAPRLERRTLAACLISIHAGLGSDGVAELLSPCTGMNLRRVLDSLENGARGGAAVRLHRVARALEGALVEQALVARKP